MGRLVAVNVYPVKAMRGLRVAESVVDPCGLAGDRRWMVVDEAGRFHTQRDLPVLATFAAVPTAAGLQLSVGRETLVVPIPGADAPRLDVVVWRSTVPARLASAESAALLGAVCRRPCRLVYLDDPGARATNPAHSCEGDRVSFADAYPVSLASVASFEDLLRRLPAAIELSRFRANVVVEGFAPYAEDRWRRLRIGAAHFRVATAIDRCVVTTIDQESGQAGQGKLAGEPLRTLARYRRGSGSVFFATHLLPDGPGCVAEGDEVEILETADRGFPPP